MFDLTTLLISKAMAADAVATATTAAPQSEGDVIMRFMPLFLIFVAFYFLLIRPQQKQGQQHDKMIADLKKGDKIITRAGFVGTISKVESDNYLMVEIAKGVEVKVVRDTVSGLVDPNHPANENKGKK